MEPSELNLYIAIATLLAVLIGAPFSTYYFTSRLQAKRIKEDLKLRIFAELMANRGTPFSYDAVKYLNLIDVVFHDNHEVRNSWAKYHNYLCDARLDNDAGYAVRDSAKLQLLGAMAQSVGKLNSISDADVARIYTPRFINEDQEILHAERQQKLQALGLK